MKKLRRLALFVIVFQMPVFVKAMDEFYLNPRVAEIFCSSLKADIAEGLQNREEWQNVFEFLLSLHERSFLNVYSLCRHYSRDHINPVAIDIISQYYYTRDVKTNRDYSIELNKLIDEDIDSENSFITLSDRKIDFEFLQTVKQKKLSPNNAFSLHELILASMELNKEELKGEPALTQSLKQYAAWLFDLWSIPFLECQQREDASATERCEINITDSGLIRSSLPLKDVREQMYFQVYSSDHWRRVFSSLDIAMMTDLVPTRVSIDHLDASRMEWLSSYQPGATVTDADLYAGLLALSCDVSAPGLASNPLGDPAGYCLDYPHNGSLGDKQSYINSCIDGDSTSDFCANLSSHLNQHDAMEVRQILYSLFGKELEVEKLTFSEMKDFQKQFFHKLATSSCSICRQRIDRIKDLYNKIEAIYIQYSQKVSARVAP